MTPMLLDIWHDIRQALRVFRTAPAFTAIAVTTLAVGLGSNTAVFSAASALLLRPLPIPQSDRLVSGIAMREGFDPFGTSLLEYEHLREGVPEFSSVGIASVRPVNLVTRIDPEQVTGADVSAGYFATLGVSPLVGRRFTAADDRAGSPAIAMIGYDLWRRRFHTRPDIVGQTLTTDEAVLTVVGVMPRGIDVPARVDLWMPARVDGRELPIDQRTSHNWSMIARLRGGAGIDAANRTMSSIAARIEREYPQYRRGWAYEVFPLRRQLLDDLDGRSERAVTLTVAAVAFVLLICCANVAGLVLVRGTARQREVAVRLALGAGRTRVVRQLAAESLVLAVAAGCGGLLLASWMTPLIAALNPIRVAAFGDALTDFRIDVVALGYTFLLSVASAAFVGVIPAICTLRSDDVAGTLKRRGDRTTADRGSRRWLNLLVVGEVALAVTLLVGSALIVRSFDHLRHVDLGFRPDRALTLQMALSPERYPDQRRRAAFVERVLDRLRALPGVEMAGASSNLPLDDVSFDSVFTVEGRAVRSQSEVPISAHRLVTPGYLEALGVRLLKGRLPDARDRGESLRTVVVTEEFARQAWPGDGNPIGRRVRRGSQEQTGNTWLTVVGVVADVKEDQFNFRINRPAWYLPYPQEDVARPVNIVLRAAGDPSALAASVRAAISAIDPAQPLTKLKPMTDQVDNVTLRDRCSAVLVASLAVVGLLLAACGLYGVVSYTVSQRRGELGLRLALGAAPADLLTLVLAQGARLIAAGVTLGLVCARALAALLSATLFGVRPGDPAIFASVAVALALIGLAACYAPARRAARLDPTAMLRSD
jgi:putative ABC transport system permease protein